MRYIVANWKQNKTINEALEWLSAFKQAQLQIPTDTTVVVAPSFVLLSDMRRYITENDVLVELAAQDVSLYEKGAYTGEVGAVQLKDVVQHVIIGHSERRKYFGETNQSVNLKVQHALSQGIHPFVCIADQITEDGSVSAEQVESKSEWFVQQIRSVFVGVDMSHLTLVYEPISAISTFGGQPLNGKQAMDAITEVAKHAPGDVAIMYGGSVNRANITEYWQYSDVAGVMPGGASLDIQEFISMLNSINALSI